MSAALAVRKVEDYVPVACGALAIVTVTTRADHMAIVVATAVSLIAVLGWIAREDMRSLTISDRAILTLAIVAIAYRCGIAALSEAPSRSTIATLVVDTTLPGGLLYLFREIYFRTKGYDGIGLGDVKLSAVGGLLVGVAGVSWALFAASLFAIGFVILRSLFGHKVERETKLAFGAALAPAILCIWLLEQVPSMSAYLGN